jgi:hypothetical protein
MTKLESCTRVLAMIVSRSDDLLGQFDWGIIASWRRSRSSIEATPVYVDASFRTLAGLLQFREPTGNAQQSWNGSKSTGNDLDSHPIPENGIMYELAIVYGTAIH